PVGQYQLTVKLATSNGCDVIFHYVGDVVTKVPVDVPLEGLKDLDVPIAEGLTMRGRIEFQGDARRPTRVDLRAYDERGLNAYGDVKGEDFEIVGLTRGRWFLHAADNALESAWSVASITLEGKDLTAAPVVVENSDLSGVVLTLTSQGASVTGKVFD